jgi:hypothetical protein
VWIGQEAIFSTITFEKTLCSAHLEHFVKTERWKNAQRVPLAMLLVYRLFHVLVPALKDFIVRLEPNCLTAIHASMIHEFIVPKEAMLQFLLDWVIIRKDRRFQPKLEGDIHQKQYALLAVFASMVDAIYVLLGDMVVKSKWLIAHAQDCVERGFTVRRVVSSALSINVIQRMYIVQLAVPFQLWFRQDTTQLVIKGIIHC